jgi:hypothetical protein
MSENTPPVCPKYGTGLNWYSHAASGVALGDIGYRCPKCFLYVALWYQGGPIFRPAARPAEKGLS